MSKLDPRVAPAYTIAEAGRYLRIPVATVRSWFVGRTYPKRSGKAQPTIERLGVTTSFIVDRVNAGESPEELARDYGATEDEIMDALAYERAA